ncbi:hypothetical protein B7463_g8430, partial [Scytalidium lignicola]
MISLTASDSVTQPCVRFGNGDITREIQTQGILFNSRRRAAAPVFMRGACTGWIDDDKSGDYDPKADREKQKRKVRSNINLVKNTGDNGNIGSLGNLSLPLLKGSASSAGLSNSKADEQHSFINSPDAYTKYNGIGTQLEWRHSNHHTISAPHSTKPKSNSNRTRKSKTTVSVDSSLTRIKHIKTAFCHPIIFNHIPDPKNKDPCSWCDSPFFGLSGHGVLDVEVLVPTEDSNSGYEELSGGHVQNGQPYSKMCVLCTFSRLRIITCVKHEIKPIPGLDPRNYNYRMLQESIEALRRGRDDGDDGKTPATSGAADGGKEQLAMRTKWCSICPAPAFYQCCSKQQFNEFGELVKNNDDDDDGNFASTENMKGCGLLLCEVCEDLMCKLAEVSKTRDNKMIIDAAVLSRTIRRAGEKFMMLSYPQGVRADTEFLTPGGELFVRLQKGI